MQLVGEGMHVIFSVKARHLVGLNISPDHLLELQMSLFQRTWINAALSV